MILAFLLHVSAYVQLLRPMDQLQHCSAEGSLLISDLHGATSAPHVATSDLHQQVLQEGIGAHPIEVAGHDPHPMSSSLGPCIHPSICHDVQRLFVIA